MALLKHPDVTKRPCHSNRDFKISKRFAPISSTMICKATSSVDALEFPTISSTIGNTPLVRLQRLQGNTSNVILLKLEGNNAAGSVKDRPALSMIEEAESKGIIKPGDRLIEATSGNTGIALAMAAAIKGYKMRLIMPTSMSEERRASMRAYGAELVLVDKGGMEAARDMALAMEARGEGRVLDQFNNPDNPLAHYRTTGPEIWEQTKGRVTHFVSSMGTTGTIMGTARYLKSVSEGPQQQPAGHSACTSSGSGHANGTSSNGNDRAAGAASHSAPSSSGRQSSPTINSNGGGHSDAAGSTGSPFGSTCGVQIVGLQPADGAVIPGIRRWPKEYLPRIFEEWRVDRVMEITQREAEQMTRALARVEGICCGISSGGAVSAALRLSAEVENAVIAVIICDRGDRYLSTGIFSEEAGADDPKPCSAEEFWASAAMLVAHPEPRYVVLTGKDPATGEEWCQRSKDVLPRLRELVRGTLGGTLLEVQVGPQEVWLQSSGAAGVGVGGSNSNSTHRLRSHPHLKGFLQGSGGGSTSSGNLPVLLRVTAQGGFEAAPEVLEACAASDAAAAAVVAA